MPYTLRSLPLPVKSLFSAFLVIMAVAYTIALIQILLTHGMADGRFGLSLEDIVYSYYGNRSGSRLELMLNGPMKPFAPPQERFKIIEWVRQGADRETFEREIRPIFERRCFSCHSKEGPGPDLTSFEALRKRAEVDMGITLQSLVRVTHVHLFGIAFIFMLTGMVFCFSSVVDDTTKTVVVALPFFFQLLDIASWWLTKMSPYFAWLVIFGGTGMGMVFAFIWTVSMYEMWLAPRHARRKKTPLLTLSFRKLLRPRAEL